MKATFTGCGFPYVSCFCSFLAIV